MKFLFWLLLILLTACAAKPSSDPQASSSVRASQVSAKAKSENETLREQLKNLPGAALQQEPLGFSYPDQVMFGKGAVLPLPGGPKLLDPLAEMLKQNPELAWQVAVRAKTEHGQSYDQALAEKRSELLATYLLSKGAELGKLDFQPDAAVGDPLVFTLKTDQ